MLRVLMFLFQNYMDQHARLLFNQDEISVELESAGFDRLEIDDALAWLAGFDNFYDQEGPSISEHNIRFYSLEEEECLHVEARGLLLYLEQNNMLSPCMREMVIDRAMALGCYIDPLQMKWVVLMTLFHHPEQRPALNWVQDFVLHGDVMH